jgi:hypothetical protein
LAARDFRSAFRLFLSLLAEAALLLLGQASLAATHRLVQALKPKVAVAVAVVQRMVCRVVPVAVEDAALTFRSVVLVRQAKAPTVAMVEGTTLRVPVAEEEVSLSRAQTAPARWVATVATAKQST